MNDKWYSLEKNIEDDFQNISYHHHSENYDNIHFSQRLYNIFQDTRFTFTNWLLEKQVPRKEEYQEESSSSDAEDDNHPKLHLLLVEQMNGLTDTLNELTNRIILLESLTKMLMKDQIRDVDDSDSGDEIEPGKTQQPCYVMK